MLRRRRRKDAPVPLAPKHRADWRHLWRRCTCGYRWPCPDRNAPPPSYGAYVPRDVVWTDRAWTRPARSNQGRNR